MIKTVEKKLKDYKGCQIVKVIDICGNNKKITYMANNHDGDNLNCDSNLSKLKKWIDMMSK